MFLLSWLTVALGLAPGLPQNPQQAPLKVRWEKVVSSTGFANLHWVGPDRDVCWIDSGGFTLVDPKTGVVKWSFTVRGASGDVWVDKDKSRARYGSGAGLATVDLESGKATLESSIRGPAVFSADGSRIAVANDMGVKLYSGDLKEEWSLPGSSKPHLTPDGSLLTVTDSSKGETTVFQTSSKKPIGTLKVRDGGQTWRQDGAVFVVDGRRVWRCDAEEPAVMFEHKDTRAKIVSQAQGLVLVATSKGSEVWRVSDSAQIASNDRQATGGALLAPGGQTALYAGNDVSIVECAGGKLKSVLGVSGSALFASVSPGARQAVIKTVSSGRQALVVTDLSSRQTLEPLATQEEAPVFLGDDRLAHFNGKGTAIVSLPSLGVERVLNFPDSYLAARRDGAWLAVAARRAHTLWVVDPTNGRVLAQGSVSAPLDLAVSSDGRFLAVSDSAIVRVLEAMTLSDVSKSKDMTGAYRPGNFFTSTAGILAMVQVEGSGGLSRRVVAMMDVRQGTTQASQVPAERIKGSPDGTLLAAFVAGRGATLWTAPQMEPIGAVVLTSGQLRDCVPISRGSGVFFVTERRYGVAELPARK